METATDHQRGMNIVSDHQNWKSTVNEIRNPAAPTAAYWLRRQPAHPNAS